MKVLALIPASFFMAISFLWLWYKRKRFLPYESDWEGWDHKRGFTHNLKDWLVEHIRDDAQWWGKFFCFVIWMLVLFK